MILSRHLVVTECVINVLIRVGGGDGSGKSTGYVAVTKLDQYIN